MCSCILRCHIHDSRSLSSPYFIRFINLPENADLLLLLLQRIANTTVVSFDMQETIAELCQFLATMLMLQSHSALSQEDLSAATVKLQRWSREYRHTFAEDTCSRALMLLAPTGFVQVNRIRDLRLTRTQSESS